jgi:hypothetical protein
MGITIKSHGDEIAFTFKQQVRAGTGTGRIVFFAG